jgi:hypothetical protein
MTTWEASSSNLRLENHFKISFQIEENWENLSQGLRMHLEPNQECSRQKNVKAFPSFKFL